MSEQGIFRRLLATLMVWIAALAVTAALFYALDHGVMAMQGLPLSWDLTPAQ